MADRKNRTERKKSSPLIPPPLAPSLKMFHFAQMEDQVLMNLAALNELRLAVGSFAPCEVVMEGSTRVLPLVALPAASSESKVPLTEGGDARSSEEAAGGRSGVSPNRHPEARTGAPNVKVWRWLTACICALGSAVFCSGMGGDG